MSLKLAKLALCLSFAYIGNATAKSEVVEAKSIHLTQSKSSSDYIRLTDAQLLSEQQAIETQLAQIQKAEDARLYLEQQERSEQRLLDLMGNQEIQFKSALAKIYTQNDYVLLWEDQAVVKQFLREYAAMVVSGISRKSAKMLNDIHQQAEVGGLIYDILLTDAFLDYMHYTKNSMKYAQQWLYGSNTYKPTVASEQDIEAWLSAVKRGESLRFLEGLTTKNSLYKQSLSGLSSFVPAAKNDKNILSKLHKLAVNVQRLRIIPNFENGIFVNIPSYELNYYRDGKLVLESRVIVGKTARKTPVMYSKLSNVVVNPPWNPPTRLINEDIVPKIKQDPGYVSRNGYTIFDGSGRPMDPYSINWEGIGKNFPYRIRQAPGDSALGNYKFNMPSSDAIYLHDTPSRNLFAKKDRALSSGCIRVEKSDQLATILLKEAGWSEERKQTVLTSKKTTSANIHSDNPVYLYYVTAWMDNGKIHTLPDIYGYDVTPDLNYINLDVVQKYL